MLNRAIRKLAMFALPTAALLVAGVLTAGPASAAQSFPCGICFFKNLYGTGLYIVGNGHNNPLLVEGDAADLFDALPTAPLSQYSTIEEAEPGSSAFGECWNTNGTVIGLDSCPSGDTNEYFEFVLDGNYWLIQSLRTGLYVAADSVGGRLYFTSGKNDTSLWDPIVD